MKRHIPPAGGPNPVLPVVLAVLTLCVLPMNVVAQDAGPLAISLMPNADMTLGADSQIYDLAYGCLASVRYAFPFLPGLSAGVGLGYGYQPLHAASDAMHLVAAGGSLSFRLPLLPQLYAAPFAEGGYFYGMLPTGEHGGSLYYTAGLELGWFFTPQFGLQIQGAWRDYVGLQSGLSIGIGPVIALGRPGEHGQAAQPVTSQPAQQKPAPLANPQGVAPSAAVTGQAISFTNANLSPVFPVFYKYYEDHSFGQVTLKNAAGANLDKVSVSFYVKEYMDEPKVIATADSLAPGKDLTANVIALFNDNMMGISEATKLVAKITVSYTQAGTAADQESTYTLRVYDRNASMWDDNRRVAAFVTEKDPAVLSFAKNVAAMTKDKGSKAVNQNLRMAMAMHEALRLYGLTYVTDPSSSYEEASQNKEAVDFLQFPRQTLDYKSGDCDDLSILYAALLESVGIETAFITIPGHIFMAFSLAESPEKAREDFSQPDELIFSGDKTWVPLEITLRDKGFLDVWQTGAKEWREGTAKQQADLYPLHDAWSTYEAVAFPGAGTQPTLPSADKVTSNYLQELVRYIDEEIYPQVAKLQADIKKDPTSQKSINKLGVLYAKFGLDDQAEAQFKKAVEKKDYSPALVNLGHLRYLAGDMAGAVSYYTRAQKLAPDDASVLLALARVNHDMENYGATKESYDKLKEVDPALASEFAYLGLRGDEATRASDISEMKDVMVWGE